MGARKTNVWARAREVFRDADETRNQLIDTQARFRRVMRVVKAANKRKAKRPT